MYIDHKQIGLISMPYGMTFHKVEGFNEKKVLLNSIYEPSDPHMPPKNDIGVFQSSETSPEVQTFIHNNLLQEQQPTVTESALDADDDDIVDGTPRRFETLNQFEHRVEDKLQSEKRERNNRRIEKKLQENLRKQVKDD
jgi:hypothetical protein